MPIPPLNIDTMTFLKLMHRSAAPALALAACVAIFASACGGGTAQSAADRARESGFRGITLDNPTPKVDFTLTDTEGEPFHFLEETKGFITLLFFGYTHCPDVCPVHMANLAAVLKDQPWEVRNAIKVVFVTTDPERDSPERIRQWLDAFDRSFIGLTGSREEVNQIQVSFGLPPAFIQGGTATDYIVGHASQILAFGRDDTARIAYPFGTRQADWAHDLPRLVSQGPALDLSPAVIAEPITDDLTALYLTIANRGTEGDELIAVTTDLAGMTEIHTQVDHGGLTSMEEIESLSIPAGERLVLEPVGYHIMLYDLARRPEPGEIIAIELHFRRSGKVAHFATIRAYDELESALDEISRQSSAEVE